MDKKEFKILVAEDDAMVRDVMENFLAGQGYTVVTAHNGHEAIKMLRLEDIKMVLTDLRMPGADGMEVLRTAMQMNPKIAVVLITAYGTLDTALEAMKEGAYDYIVKPFVMQQLLLVVRNAYKLAGLIKENERLSRDLKEMYRRLETVNAMDSSKTEDFSGQNEHAASATGIDKLQDRNIIDADEARMLKARLSSDNANDKIKKYSSLINGLKSE